jgi:hypothetical protein
MTGASWIFHHEKHGQVVGIREEGCSTHQSNGRAIDQVLRDIEEHGQGKEEGRRRERKSNGCQKASRPTRNDNDKANSKEEGIERRENMKKIWDPRKALEFTP